MSGWTDVQEDGLGYEVALNRRGGRTQGRTDRRAGERLGGTDGLVEYIIKSGLEVWTDTKQSMVREIYSGWRQAVLELRLFNASL